MAKEAGCKVGTTTNGMVLDREKICQVVEYGLDVLAFSLAGVDERNDVVRKGTSLKKVLESIATLKEIKGGLKKEQPAVHVAYLLLQSQIEEIERLPRLFRGLGISEIVVTTLDFLPCEGLSQEAIRPSTEDAYEEIRERLEVVRGECRKEEIGFHYYLRRPQMRSMKCTENIERAVFISSDGTVSPCVFLNLPVSQGIQMYRNEKMPYQPLHLGNVTDTPLEIIWWAKPYRAFRKAFAGGGLPPTCIDCPKLFMG
jgi:MoaA/NifB/PqqE/SkfB family radical SAM enzyme